MCFCDFVAKFFYQFLFLEFCQQKIVLMKTRITALILTTACIFFVYSCNKSEINNFKVAFYNVENLFDTLNTKGSRDGEYTPTSELKWDTKKYLLKIEKTAKVIRAIDSTNLPAIIGLCEIENRLVLEDLIRNHQLRDAGYAIVHHESPDERGIDVALLYRTKFFTVITDKAFKVKSPQNQRDRTRDLLYVKGVTATRDTLHVLVDHWASRMGGEEKSIHKRKNSARFVKKVTDSIFSTNPNSNIIFMGDLNDNPNDSSLTVVLKAKMPVQNPKSDILYNLSLMNFANGEGTLYYKSWDLFDQMIVSGNILAGKTTQKLKPVEMHIFKPDWLLFKKRNGLKVPNRTGGGKNYSGGYSDHLPVYINFSK